MKQRKDEDKARSKPAAKREAEKRAKDLKPTGDRAAGVKGGGRFK